ncbi:hypothetical protein L3V77_18595 [Vibrio sp. DW001]|uniref:hypothetical protein n=1 Tax=Vibrio sp. DW001 TaxID=2912315 RepID=UPI0023AF31D7|nr:hypothetical protein [Vibrio sp. DW001]WED29435.1 hypothetical protein L3V77_18595 [Vibrio sp. DW001]
MKKILLFILFITFTQSANATTYYCSDSNWDKLSTLFNKTVKSYKQLLREIDEYEIKTNPSAFIHNRYTLKEYSAMWHMNNDVDRKSVERFITNTQAQIDRVEEINIKLQALKKNGRNLEYNWEKLAGYCNDEDQYDDYKSATKNYESATNNLNIIKAKIKNLKETKVNYATELEFFMKTKELSK